MDINNRENLSKREIFVLGLKGDLLSELLSSSLASLKAGNK